MPTYRSRDNVFSGVPLGGIGAGKMEFLPNGLFNAFTFQNNWSKPLVGNTDYPGILGFHLGILVKKKALMLQTIPVAGIPTVRGIRYEGVFPSAKIFYEEPGLGLDLCLEVFSSWVPGDVKNSGLPCTFFTLNVTNKKKTPVDFRFIFIGRNTCGRWCVGRQNRVVDEKKKLHLEFLNHDPSQRDSRQGALRFSFLKKGWTLSFIDSWNAVRKNFSFDSKNISLEGWDTFVKEGFLPNRNGSHVASGENEELCGAVAARRILPAGATRELSFVGSWYFPRHPLGHRYEKWFKNCGQVSSYAIPRRDVFKKKLEKFKAGVFSLPFPPWFNHFLLDNLSPFFSSTWLVKDGRFSFYEAPVVCPLMGTLDVGFYGSIPLSYFFPELELSLIGQFAAAQRADGYIPHDLGKNRLDLPSNGTTFYLWKDLNPKFILMAYRDFLWSGNDKTFLKKVYPAVKKALYWSLKSERNRQGLPLHEGADQTFDLWEFKGMNPYTSSLFLAALLACEKMAGLLGDLAFSRDVRHYFLKGSQSFEKLFWNGSYFGETCMLSQLNGQWYADLLGLGSIVDPVKIKKALKTILVKNGGPSRFGMVNSVLSDGRLDTANDHSKNVWSGMNYAFISLCVLRGFPMKDLLLQNHKIWDNTGNLQKSPWNQPDTIDSRTGRYVFGDSYYRNMAIWSIPIALGMRDKKTSEILKSIKKL